MSSLVLMETLGSRSALVTLIRGKIAAAAVVVAGIITTRTLHDQHSPAMFGLALNSI